MHTLHEVNGVSLAAEHFGDSIAPLILCIGSPTMLSWPDALCESLAAAGRHVVRYDLRDAGESTTIDPENPAYTLRDLASDAAALAKDIDDRPSYLAGIGVSGMVAQVAAIEHQTAFSGLILYGTRPVAPGPVDEDLPDHDGPTMERLFSLPMPDWVNRDSVAEYAAASAQMFGDDPEVAHTTAVRVWDRTPRNDPAVNMANQMGTVFSKIDCSPRWREKLHKLDLATHVVHGQRDPFFPVGNGEALVRDIPRANRTVFEDASTAIPGKYIEKMTEAMLWL